MSAERTPGPWTVDDTLRLKKGGLIVRSDDYAICGVYDVELGNSAQNKANAVFIVKACNAHDELVLRLTEATALLDRLIGEEVIVADAPEAAVLIEYCRAALAKAQADGGER